MDCPDCNGSINCPTKTASACIDYTGKVSTLIKNLVPCKPTLDDILPQIQKLIEDVKRSLGDNRLLDKDCFEFNELIVTQKDLNQLLLYKCCALQRELDSIGSDLSLTALQISMDINLLCIENELCTPLSTYTLDAIIRKMITKICTMDDRITVIENFLGL